MQIDQQLAEISNWIGLPLDKGYQAFLANHGGQFVGDIVRFYGVDEVIERNECYETRLYCPGFLAIGDDSGGRAIVVHSQLSPPEVFVVDHGSMSPEDFELVSSNLLDWVNNGCPL